MRFCRQLAAVMAAIAFSSHMASAKPKSVLVDATFDRCGWAAEVTVLDVGDAIRVRVTEDFDAIYRGHPLLGAVVDVQPVHAGDATCRSDLLRFAGTRTKMLMVVDQNGQVQLVGEPKPVDDVPGYHLRTWFDYNAVWFRSDDKEFGRTLGDTFDGKYGVTKKQISSRFLEERNQLMLALTSILLRPRASLPESDIKTTIARLGDDKFYVREAAQRELLSLDAGAVEFLQQQADATSDLEVGYRLGQIIRRIQSPLEQQARAVRNRGAKHEAGILVEAYDVSRDHRLRDSIVARLSVLAEEHSDIAISRLTTPAAVVSAWKDAVKRD